MTDFVDDDSIKRNTDWILSRRKKDGSGSFKVNPKALDSFGRASQDITDFYVVWTLSAIKGNTYESLKEEFGNVIKICETTKDPYLLSLAAGALFNVGKIDLAKEQAAKLVTM